MAAVGPPQQQVRMAHQQVWAALEVALRVPCLYIIDAIFNSYYDSSQSRFCLGLQIFLRLLGKGNRVACVPGRLCGPRRAEGSGWLRAGRGSCVCTCVCARLHTPSVPYGRVLAG